MPTLATAETDPSDGSIEHVNHVYSLYTEDLVGDGTRAHDILERTGIHVLRGTGVVADRHGDGPHVVYELDRDPTRKAAQRLGNVSLRLEPGEQRLN
ncbi:TPA: hypothetical protein DIS56_01110 [Candidatus Saccharibacteria bacterium]|nr:MAG: hypothetical protein A3F05_02470 [Candidatus Saccharibacteria bacterium RIFCSPHIGHO2_12_FULL_47_17]HCM51718.1 hypothetical protein [Candidatus Saccharibacteria bacterium]